MNPSSSDTSRLAPDLARPLPNDAPQPQVAPDAAVDLAAAPAEAGHELSASHRYDLGPAEHAPGRPGEPASRRHVAAPDEADDARPAMSDPSSRRMAVALIGVPLTVLVFVIVLLHQPLGL